MASLPNGIRRIGRRLTGKGGYQNCDFPGRHNLDARWNLIQPNLPSNPGWFLDVGSNNGDTLRRLTELGHFGLGLEVDRAAAGTMLPDNTAIMITEVQAATFASMPRFSGVFMLSVFHRIWALQGPESAKAILRAVGGSADLLVFEGCSRHARYTSDGAAAPEFQDMNVDDSVAWHEALFRATIEGGSATFVGVTETVKTKDPRPLFVVKTPNAGDARSRS